MPRHAQVKDNLAAVVKGEQQIFADARGAAEGATRDHGAKIFRRRPFYLPPQKNINVHYFASAELIV